MFISRLSFSRPYESTIGIRLTENRRKTPVKVPYTQLSETIQLSTKQPANDHKKRSPSKAADTHNSTYINLKTKKPLNVRGTHRKFHSKQHHSITQAKNRATFGARIRSFVRTGNTTTHRYSIITGHARPRTFALVRTLAVFEETARRAFTAEIRGVPPLGRAVLRWDTLGGGAVRGECSGCCGWRDERSLIGFGVIV